MRTFLQSTILVVVLLLALFVGSPSVLAQTPTNDISPLTNADIDGYVRECFAKTNPELRLMKRREGDSLSKNFSELTAPYLLHNLSGLDDCTDQASNPVVGAISLSCTSMKGAGRDGECTLLAASDSSSWVIKPNLLVGSTYKNFDSSGEEAGHNNTGVGGTTTGTAEGKNLGDTDPNQCSFQNIGQCFLNLPGLLFSALAFLLLTLSSIILGIAGVVFNWVVIRTVFQFALYFGTSPGMRHCKHRPVVWVYFHGYSHHPEYAKR